MNIKSYLNQVSDIYKLQLPSIKNTIVMGNTSCDLDSVSSCLLMSILKNYIEGNFESLDSFNPHILSIKPADQIKKLFIPILACGKSELFFRLEIKLILSIIKVDQTDFIYFEDINFIGKELILVDHHELDFDHQHLKDLIIEIYDHHDETGFNFESTYLNLKQPPNIGVPRCSALSLVLEDLFYDKINKIGDDKIVGGICDGIGRRELLLQYLFGVKPIDEFEKIITENPMIDIFICPLIIDSGNFKKGGLDSKWSQIDFELLMKILNRNNHSGVILSSRHSIKKSNTLKSSHKENNNIKPHEEGDTDTDDENIKVPKYYNLFIEDLSLGASFRSKRMAVVDDCLLKLDSEVSKSIKEISNKFTDFTNELSKTLKKAKKDVDLNLSLGFGGLFNKDRKNFIVVTKNNETAKITMSTIPLNIKKIYEKFGEDETYKQAYMFLEQNSSDLYIFKTKAKDKIKGKKNIEKDSLSKLKNSEFEEINELKECKEEVKNEKTKKEKLAVYSHVFSNKGLINNEEKVKIFAQYIEKILDCSFRKIEFSNGVMHVYADETVSRKFYWPVVKIYYEKNL